MFWIIKTPRSSVDLSVHQHIIFAMNRPKVEVIAGPFNREGDAIDWMDDMEKSYKVRAMGEKSIET